MRIANSGNHVGRSLRRSGVKSAIAWLSMLALGASGVAAAQDEESSAPVQPRPAEIMSRADQSLLLDVTFTGKHFVAVGERGDILVSNDGKAWAQVQVPVRAPLTAVQFVNDEQGWAVGHDAVILHTEDGGRTWSLQNFEPELEQPFLDLYFLDAQRGYAVGAYGMMVGTDDAGLSWEPVDAPAIRDEELHFNSITQLADGTLFIAGESTMMGFSRDHGETWTRFESPYDGTLFGALPFGEHGVLVYGMRGNVLYTKDLSEGLEGWTALDTQTVASFFGGTRLPGGGYALVGLNGQILELQEDGQIAARESTGRADSLAAVTPIGDGLLLVGTAGTARLSLNK